MEPTRLRARVEHKNLEELESGFADRVSARALFLARRQLEGAADVEVGARVRVEVLLASGEPALVVDGVVAWAISVKPPPGREPGLGIAITASDAASAASLQRMAGRPGWGGRVRVPGQRLADRLRLGQALLQPPAWSPPAPRPTAPAPTAAPMAAPAPFASLFPPELAPERPTSDRPLPRLLGLFEGDSGIDSSAEPTQHPLAPRFETPELEAPAPPVGDVTAAGEPGIFLEGPTLDGLDHEAAPQPAASPSSEGLASLPDAPPLDRSPFSENHEAPRPFESQSTDVDLLASISAAELVGLDPAHARPLAPDIEPKTDPGWREGDDLPSADAELVTAGDWDHAPAEAAAWPALELSETLVFDPRSLPEADAWPPGSDLVDARPIGTFCSFGKRGAQNVEQVTWPTDGTKRFSRSEVPPEPADSDVFASGHSDPFAAPPELDWSSSSPAVAAAPPAPIGLDPFAPAATDPRLNVEGVVARAFRTAQGDSDVDADVFSGSGAGDAGDEILGPQAGRPILGPQAGPRAELAPATSSPRPSPPPPLEPAELAKNNATTDPDLRRPPSKEG